MNSAYVLLEFENNISAQESYMNFSHNDNVVYCDAISGGYDLMLLIQSETVQGLIDMVDKEIKTISGIKNINFMPISGGKLSGLMNLTSSASSYVMLDVAKMEKENVFMSLLGEHQIASFDYVDGFYDAVLLIQGSSFMEIDHIIQNHIKQLDGVLRIKKLPIIKLLER